MFPEDVLERNRAFVQRHHGRPLPPLDAVGLGIVTCFDPRLDTMLRPALGLGEDEGFLLRVPGAFVHPDVLRPLCLSVLFFQLDRLLVLGHSSCAMAQFNNQNFISTFRSRGIRRDAFGHEDLRAWAGAIPSPRAGVLRSVAAIAAAPMIPSDVEIAGALLNDTTGAVELVVDPKKARSGAPVVAAFADEEEPAEELPRGMDEVLEALDGLASLPQLAVPVTQLRNALVNEHQPAQQVNHLEAFLRDVDADTADLRATLARARRELAGKSPAYLLRHIVPLLHKKG